MSTQNGLKLFLYIVLHKHEDKGDGAESLYFCRSDHDPTEEEIVEFFDIDFEQGAEEEIEVIRHSIEDIPILSPKKP